jgi:sialate O-acetylesterase
MRVVFLLPALLVGMFLAMTLTVSVAAQAAESTSKPFLQPLFTDNMVLQRGVKDAIWGWTTPGQRVTVRMEGKSASATADATGRWLVKIGPFPVGGPYTLTVTGPQTMMLRNVLVGDVWLLTGQSNMVMGVNFVTHAAEEVAHADYPQIRLMTVPQTVAIEPQQTFGSECVTVTNNNQPMGTFPGHWVVCAPDTVKQGIWGGFSAAGYFFAREVYQQTHIPIGLIETAIGGTPAESWVSAESLVTMKDFQPRVQAIRDAVQATNEHRYEQFVADWSLQHDAGLANNNAWSAPNLDTAAWSTMTIPYYFPEKFLVGVLWLRREVEVPADWAGKPLTLHLGPIDDADTTFVNGVKVGETSGYDKLRDYSVPANLIKSGRNVITVRLTNLGGPGGIYGKPVQLQLELPGQTQEAPIPLAGEWKYQISTDFTKTPIPMVPNLGNTNEVTVLYNSMIAPLVSLRFKGALWYQGESNALVNGGYQYRTLLPLLIKDWRMHLGQGDFPFYIVQIAGYNAPVNVPMESSWAEVREAQLLTARSMPHTGLAVVTDTAEDGNLHPLNKQEAGRRLALIALANLYGKRMEYSGPLYRAMKIEGKSIRLYFDHLGGGLLAKGDKLTSFAIAGADKRFVWADAVIQGDTVLVSAPQVTQPVAVRYAWATTPVCSLFNKAGLPASPFRTDSDVKP